MKSNFLVTVILEFLCLARLTPGVLSENKRYHSDGSSISAIEWTAKDTELTTRVSQATSVEDAGVDLEWEQSQNNARNSIKTKRSENDTKANLINTDEYRSLNSTDYDDDDSKNGGDDDEEEDEHGDDEEEEEEEEEDNEGENETEIETDQIERKYGNNGVSNVETVRSAEPIKSSDERSPQSSVEPKKELKTSKSIPSKNLEDEVTGNFDGHATENQVEGLAEIPDTERTGNTSSETTGNEYEEDFERDSDDPSVGGNRTQETDEVLNKIIRNLYNNTSENASLETDNFTVGAEENTTDNISDEEGSGYPAKDGNEKQISDREEGVVENPAEKITVESGKGTVGDLIEKNSGTTEDEPTGSHAADLTGNTADDRRRISGTPINEGAGETLDQETTTENVASPAENYTDLTGNEKSKDNGLEVGVSVVSDKKSNTTIRNPSQMETVKKTSSAASVGLEPVRKGKINVRIEQYEPSEGVTEQVENLSQSSLQPELAKTDLPEGRMLVDSPEIVDLKGGVKSSVFVKPADKEETSDDVTKNRHGLFNVAVQKGKPVDWMQKDDRKDRRPMLEFENQTQTYRNEPPSDVTQSHSYSDLTEDWRRIGSSQKNGEKGKRPFQDSFEIKRRPDLHDRTRPQRLYPDSMAYRKFTDLTQNRRNRIKNGGSKLKSSEPKRPADQHQQSKFISESPYGLHSISTERQRIENLQGSQNSYLDSLEHQFQSSEKEDSKHGLKSLPTEQNETPKDITQGSLNLNPDLSADQKDGNDKDKFALFKVTKPAFEDELLSDATQSPQSSYSDSPDEEKLDNQNGGGENKRPGSKSSVIMRPTDKSLWAGLTTESMAKRILGALEKSSKKPLESKNEISPDRDSTGGVTPEKVPENKVIILPEKDVWRSQIDGAVEEKIEEKSVSGNEERTNEMGNPEIEIPENEKLEVERPQVESSEAEKQEIETEEEREKQEILQFPKPTPVEEVETDSQEGKSDREEAQDEDLKNESPRGNTTNIPTASAVQSPAKTSSTSNTSTTDSDFETDEMEDLKLPPPPPGYKSVEAPNYEDTEDPSTLDAPKNSDLEIETEVLVDQSEPTKASNDAPKNRKPNYRVTPRKHQSLRAPQRILGASYVDLSDHPYVALLTARIEARLVHLCTTAIIAEEWTLTCAHCFFMEGELLAINRLMVVSGQATTGINNLSLNATISVAKEIHIHPMYQERSFESITHDLGLVKVRRPFTFGDYCQKIPIRAVPLPYITDPDTDMLIPLLTQSFGWETESAQLDVMNVSLRRGDVDTCPCIYWRHSRGLFCTFRKGGESICKGDYGGPLVYRSHLIGVAQGIRSARCDKAYLQEDDDCADNTKYAMYINTCPFLDWMGRHVPGLPHQPEECYLSRSGLLAPQFLFVSVAVFVIIYVWRV